MPPDKSPFHSRPGCGLPIGNLASQVFANFYPSSFDHLVHPDRAHLAALVPLAADYLQRELGLTLHPRKIYLQHYAHGV